jgi:hypothetical protein
MVVEEVCLAGIDRRDWLTGFLQVRATLLTEMFFEKNGVAGVGSENGIQNITGKWYEADDEIESDVHEHLDLQSHGETTFNLAARLHHQHREQGVKHVSNAVQR